MMSCEICGNPDVHEEEELCDDCLEYEIDPSLDEDVANFFRKIPDYFRGELTQDEQ